MHPRAQHMEHLHGISCLEPHKTTYLNLGDGDGKREGGRLKLSLITDVKVGVVTHIQHVQVKLIVDIVQVDHEHMLVRDALASQELAIFVSLWKKCKQKSC